VVRFAESVDEPCGGVEVNPKCLVGEMWVKVFISSPKDPKQFGEQRVSTPVFRKKESSDAPSA
jgi:hypothetical protein